MEKFTRGPWAQMPEECDKPYIRIRGTRPGGRYKIANVLTPVYEGVHEREAAETRANALLIGAAPELLEALQKIVELDNDAHPGLASWCVARSKAHDAAVVALAKATGEQA